MDYKVRKECYYMGLSDEYCHAEFIENIDKTECNMCENIECMYKQNLALKKKLEVAIVALQSISDCLDFDCRTGQCSEKAVEALIKMGELK